MTDVVTSPRALPPAQPGSQPDPARTAARYRAQISGLRRWSRNLLVVGTVVATVCAFGSVWFVRAGLAAALGAALISCLLAWREIDLERRAHAAAMLAASVRHGEQLTRERRHNATVVETISRRLQDSHTVAGSRAATIARLHVDLHRLQGDVNGLRGANSRLTRDLNFRDVTIRELEQTVAERDAQLRDSQPRESQAAPAGDALDRTDGSSVVQAFPRRPLRDAAEPAPASAAGSAAGSEAVRMPDDPSGTDADSAEARTAAFLAAEAAISMPNYEEDRRFA